MNKLLSIFSLLIIASSLNCKNYCNSNSDCILGANCQYVQRNKLCMKHQECHNGQKDCPTGFVCHPNWNPPICTSKSCKSHSECGAGSCYLNICLLIKHKLDESIFMEEEEISDYNTNNLLLSFGVGAVLGSVLFMLIKRKEMAKSYHEVEITPIMVN